MELFYSNNISSGGDTLDEQESNHCVKVLRHRAGDTINVIDGRNRLYRCIVLEDNPKRVRFSVDECIEGYGSHPYHLHMAVAPPKNIDRFEWFSEKATEIGVDEITPLFGDYSERRVFKPERVERLLVSAAKQSHKSAIPILHAPATVRDFICATADSPSLKIVCYCDDVQGSSFTKSEFTAYLRSSENRDIIVMIGPEGDFSRGEIEAAVAAGWKVASLGESRLRIETAAIVATAAVYLERT